MKTHRRGEAPLPLVLAGVAALTAVMVIVGGLVTRSGREEAPGPTGPKYIQTLEGVMDTFGRRGSAAAARPAGDLPAGGGGSSAPRVELAGSALQKKMMSMVSSPDVLLRQLGHRSGDFVYSKQRGWLKFDPARGGLEAIGWNELPDDMRERYPSELFPSRGRKPSAGEENPSGSRGRDGRGPGGSGTGGGALAAGGGEGEGEGRGVDGSGGDGRVGAGGTGLAGGGAGTGSGAGGAGSDANDPAGGSGSLGGGRTGAGASPDGELLVKFRKTPELAPAVAP